MSPRHPQKLRGHFWTASALTVALSSGFACARAGSTGPVDQKRLAGIAPGLIHLDLLADGDPVMYWQYSVSPQDGQVKVTSHARFRAGREDGIPHDFDRPTGKIDACRKNPESASPDGQFVARCQNEGERKQFSVTRRDAFVLQKRTTAEEIFHWRMEERRRIEGFSWSPDSSAVCVLNERQDFVRLAFLGHMAIPYDAVYLDVIGVEGQFAEYLVRREVAYAWARILHWTAS